MNIQTISIAQARSIIAYAGVAITSDNNFASFVHNMFEYHGKGIDELHRYIGRIPNSKNTIEVKMSHTGYPFQQNYNIKSLTLKNKITSKWMQRIVDCEKVMLITNFKRYSLDRKYIETIDINAIILNKNHLNTFLDYHNKRSNYPVVYVPDIKEGHNKFEMFSFDCDMIDKQMILSNVKYTKEQWDELNHAHLYSVHEFDDGYSHWGVNYYQMKKDQFEVGKKVKVTISETHPKNFSQHSFT